MLPLDLRRSDVFGIVGLILLLVWAPGYVALDPMERDLSQDDRFTLPDPRVGDRMTLELVVQVGGQTHTVHPVVEVRHRSPEPDECGVPAVLVEDREVMAHHEAAGPLVYKSDWRRERYCFDAAGSLVWAIIERHGDDHWRNDEDGQRETVYQQESGRPVPGGLLSPAQRDAGKEVRHTTSTLHALGMEGLSQFDGNAIGSNAPRFVVSSAAAVHMGAGYYGASSVTARMFEGLFNPDHGGYEDESILVFPYEQTRLQSADRTNLTAQESAVWWTPDWPTRVGSHHVLRTAEGQEAVVDILPRELKTGEGAATRLRNDDAPPSRPPRADAESWRPLSSVRDGDRPLLRDVDMQQVVSWLEADAAPEAARQHMQQGSSVVSFGFWDFGRVPLVESESGPLPPLPPLPGDGSGDDMHFHSVYAAAVADAGGDVAVVRMDVSEHYPGPVFDVTYMDLCDESRDEEFPFVTADCKPLPPHLVAPDRMVLPPGNVLEQIYETQEAISATDGIWKFGWLPIQEDHANGWRGRPIGWMGAIPSFDRHSVLQPDGGIARFDVRSEEKRISGAVDLADGHPLSHHLYVPDESRTGRADALPLAVAAAGVPVEHLVLYAQTAALGGLLLILLSLFLRMLGAIKSGAHIVILAPLFSRITQGQALLHERRGDIMALIQEEPGLTAKEIGRRLGLGWGVTAHHLEKLVANGHLEATRNGQMRHYFVPGLPSATRLRLALLHESRYRAFLEAIERAPGVTLQDLLDGLPQGPTGASRTGSRLARLGLIEKRRDGRHVRYYPARRV